MASVKKNILYSSILTVANYVFPLLTYPYISRVLGVTNVGICNFIDSVINYYVLFSMMGISTVAVREIAKNRNDKQRLSASFSSLLTLNFVSTTIVILVLIASIYIVPTLHEHKEMMYIGVFKVFFNFLLIEWFYKGIEDFKYITNRTLAVKTIYVISVFFFVRESEDYDIYYALTVAVIVVNAVINITYSRNFAAYTFRGVKLSTYLKPFLVLGVYSLLTSMYISFNVAYLGFVSGVDEVGYYTTATKIFAILLSLFTAFTTVLLPRMSALAAEQRETEFRKMVDKSIDILFLFAMPVIVLAMTFSSQIVELISGRGYEGAIVPMRIMAPLVFVIGYEQIIIVQVLTPLKKDKAILTNSVLGATVGLTMNLLLVGRLGSMGSAMVWGLAEVTVLCSGQYFVSKYVGFDFPYRKLFTNVLYAVPVAIVCCFISRMALPFYGVLLMGGAVVSFYYFIVDIFIIKNSNAINILKTISKVKTDS